ncbi:MAG: ferritin [Spirochaetota bacterium]
MLKPEVAKALNEQVGREFGSAYIYLAMSLRCSSLGLNGAANWFRVQFQEEMAHVDKFCKYITDQGADVVLGSIDQPKNDYNDLLEMFEATLEHEQYITSSINNLVKVARENNDYATEVFLQWYITEQVEEEANDSDIISRLKLIGDNGSSLFLIDKDLASRVFMPPTTQ